MKAQLLKALQRHQLLDMVYIADDGNISKRRIRLLKMSGGSFQAYCFLRHGKRSFKVDNVLSVMPVAERSRLVI